MDPKKEVLSKSLCLQTSIYGTRRTLYYVLTVNLPSTTEHYGGFYEFPQTKVTWRHS